MQKNYESIHSLREEELFHDQWAKGFDPASVIVDQSFSTPSCPENCFIFQQLGDIRGKLFLELGTGLGEGAVYFAKQGAVVIATDISSGMLRLTKEVAALHQVAIQTIQMDASCLTFPDNYFDFVYGANVLHHVDTHKCLTEVKRVLKPGGKAAFWDPLRYNPIINAYRKMADQVRSDDEHPLGKEEWQLMRSLFTDVQTNFYWLTTLFIFLKFYLVDQIHPNEERYWKKVIYEYPRIANLYTPLYSIDHWLLKIPGIRWLAWNMAVVLTK